MLLQFKLHYPKIKNSLTDICGFLLILLFTYAAVSKLYEHAAFIKQLAAFPVLKDFPVVFAWFVPMTEIVVVALLFVPAWQKKGLYGAAILLGVFTLFLVLMKFFARQLPCSCGGIISALNWNQHIGFNIFFLAVAIAGLKLMHKEAHANGNTQNYLLQ